jgi:hypothetical protein
MKPALERVSCVLRAYRKNRESDAGVNFVRGTGHSWGWKIEVVRSLSTGGRLRYDEIMLTAAVIALGIALFVGIIWIAFLADRESDV